MFKLAKLHQTPFNLVPVRCLSNVSPNPAPKSTEKPLSIFSAIQPTGALHLGNYFGAIRQWIDYSSDPRVERTIYSVVDLHSLTSIRDKQQINENIKLMTASLLGCGLDPNKSIIFRQSDVPFHGQLAWILGTLSTIAQLNRFPQFKDKTEGLKEIPLGLFLYPVLQVADILLYKSNAVPIGDDQLPHLNFAKDLCQKFNTTFKPIFPEPRPLCPELTGRIKSLRTPDKKMSKSEPNLKSRIEITDSCDEIREKLKKAVTDMKSEVTFDPQKRPGVSNLILIYSLTTGLTPKEVCEQNRGRDTGQFKLILSDLLIEKLKPIRENTLRLLSEDLYLEQVLSAGSLRAQEIAEQTMAEVYDAIGSKVIDKNVKNFTNKVFN